LAVSGELAAFMSYGQFDDEHDDGELAQFRKRLAAEVRAQTGRDFTIFQDRADVAWGENWQHRIDEALDAVALLLVIITPGLFRSEACRAEVARFLQRERDLGRSDLILPVYYITAREIEDSFARDSDELAQVLASRRFADWRRLRFEPLTSPKAREATALLASRIRDVYWRQGQAVARPPAVAGPPAVARSAAVAGPTGDARLRSAREHSDTVPLIRVELEAGPRREGEPPPPGNATSLIEVAISPSGRPGRYQAEVVRSPAGEASAEATLDVGGLLAGRARFEEGLLASGLTTFRDLTAEERAVREVGQALFTALLGTGEVAGLYRASAALADVRDEGLRIVLRLGAPELAGLPWEAMYDPGVGGFVCRRHRLVRYVPVAAAHPPLSIRPPLRVLGVVSNPDDQGTLDTDRERAQLTRALSGLADQGLAELVWAPSATWDGLLQALMAGPWHVVHFIGHGDFDPDRDEGILALTGEDGQADLIEAARFADLLRQARPMPRLVMLNSCSGATVGAGDLFSGTAAALARSGVAAVTAMQYAVTDAAAVAFARGFYPALAHGRSLDEAISAGRLAILGTSNRTLEWITPVMYLRGHDTRLFALPPRSDQ
jgi:hypothetical protein